MLCDNCRENDGIVRLTTVKDGVMTQLFLCERCAAERGVETTASASKNPLGDFIQSLHQQKPGLGGDDSSTCQFCGATTQDFRASGRLGCARCYTAFERQLRDLLRRLHGNSRHQGRRYEPPALELIERAGTVAQLRDRLRRAIDNEQFELAAELRDRLRAVES
jgi:protein arginine kinase activator